jgi:DNA (cytosine-5)-methyltransferase 1
MNKAAIDIQSIEIGDLNYYDIEKENSLFDGEVLPKATTFDQNSWITVKDAIGDLSNTTPLLKSQYIFNLNKTLNFQAKKSELIKNHNVRKHAIKIKKRFLFYQLLNYSSFHKDRFLKLKKNGDQPSKVEIKELYVLLNEKVAGFNGIFKEIYNFERFVLDVMPTRKHSQRARIQSFPDWFIFKSKETTGGKNRSYEVPQYTQVGNAVPPLLAFHLGNHIYKLLDKIDLRNGLQKS